MSTSLAILRLAASRPRLPPCLQVSLRLATLKSTQAMAEAMGGATKAMRMMNKRLNIPQLQNIMREFERQNERMEVRGWGKRGAVCERGARGLTGPA